MPDYIDPSWEYWTPSIEMLQVFEDDSYDIDAIARIGIEWDRIRDVGGNLGFRFGRDEKSLKWLPYKLGRNTVKIKEERELKCRGCRRWFKPPLEKPWRKYCCKSCRPICGAPRLIPDCVCATCGIAFRPLTWTQEFCGWKCVPKERKTGRPRSGKERTCPVCVTVFYPNKNLRQIFCCRKCCDDSKRKHQ